MQLTKRAQGLRPPFFARLYRFVADIPVLPVAVSATGIVLSRITTLGWTFEAILFFLVLPMAVLLTSRKKLLDYGLRVGDWKKGVLAAVTGVGLSIVVVGVAAGMSPGVQSYYGNRDITPRLVFDVAAYMFAWEFLLRGYLLNALQQKIGFHRANVIQSIVFFLAHSTKPPLEFYSTAFTGPVFGVISEKCRSIYSMVAIHTAIYLAVIYFT